MKKLHYILIVFLGLSLHLGEVWGQCASCPTLDDIATLSGAGTPSGANIYTAEVGTPITINLPHTANACVGNLELYYSENVAPTGNEVDADTLYAPNISLTSLKFISSFTANASGTTTVNWTIPCALEGKTIAFFYKLGPGNLNIDPPPNPVCLPWGRSDVVSNNMLRLSVTALKTNNTVSDPTVCSNAPNVQFTVSGTQLNHTYQVMNGVTPIGTPVAGGNGTTITFTVPTPASSVSYSVQVSQNGCTDMITNTADITVTSVPLNNVTAPAVTACNNASTVNVVLNGTENGVVYRVKNGPTTIGQATASGTSVTISISAMAGMFDLEAERSGCVTALTAKANITLTAPASVSTPYSVSDVCQGASAAVSIPNSESGVTYQLLLSGTPVGGPVSGGGAISLSTGALNTPGGPFNYKIQATKGACVVQLNGNASVNVNPTPGVTLSGGGSYCSGTSSPNVTIALGPGSSSPSWTYTLSNGGGSGTVTGSGTTTVSGLSDGTYAVTTVTDGKGCVNTNNSSNVSIAVRPSLSGLTVTAPSTEICAGDPVTLTLSLPAAPGSNVSVNLSNGVSGTIPGNGSSVTVSVSPSTTTTYSLTSAQFANSPTCQETTFNGGSNSVTVTVRNTLDNANITRDSLRHCFGAPVGVEVELNNTTASVNAVASVEFTDAAGAKTTGNIFVPAGAGLGDTTLSPGVKGSYEFELLSLEYVNAPLCRVDYTNESTSVRVLADLNLTRLFGDTLCTGNDAELTVDLPEEGFNVCVTLDQGLTQQCVNPGSSTADVTFGLGNQANPVTRTYNILSVQYDAPSTPACAATILDSDELRVLQTPEPDFSVPNTTYCLAEVVSFNNLTLPEASRSFYTYEWSFGDGTTGSGVNPSHVYRSEGTFNVTLKAMSGDECEEMSVGTVNIDGGHQPATIYKLTKQGAPGVLLVAFDENGNNKNILEYTWYDSDFQVLAQTTADEPYYYVADVNEAVGIFVTTRIENSDCEPASLAVQRVGDLPDLEPVMRLFPNPNQGTFNLEISGPISGNGTLRIVDLMGRVVYQESMEKSVDKLNLKLSLPLSAGQYLVQFGISGQPILHQRLTIQ